MLLAGGAQTYLFWKLEIVAHKIQLNLEIDWLVEFCAFVVIFFDIRKRNWFFQLNVVNVFLLKFFIRFLEFLPISHHFFYIWHLLAWYFNEIFFLSRTFWQNLCFLFAILWWYLHSYIYIAVFWQNLFSFVIDW